MTSGLDTPNSPSKNKPMLAIVPLEQTGEKEAAKMLGTALAYSLEANEGYELISGAYFYKTDTPMMVLAQSLGEVASVVPDGDVDLVVGVGARDPDGTIQVGGVALSLSNGDVRLLGIWGSSQDIIGAVMVSLDALKPTLGDSLSA